PVIVAWIASRRFVLPAPFGAATTVRPGSGSSCAERYDRKSVSESRDSSIWCRLADGRGAARSAMAGPLGGRSDRHDDVDVVVLADAADDAGSQRPGQLERRLVGPERAQHVDQVAGVEGN